MSNIDRLGDVLIFIGQQRSGMFWHTMLMKQSFIIILLCLFKLCANAQTTFKYQDKTFIYILRLDSALSADRVNYECFVKSISVIKKADNKLLQTIIPPENKFFCDMPEDQVFIIEDINFDKINDIRMIQFIPAAPNIPYYYWTFNNSKRQFERNTSLEGITSPDFDHKREIITSFWRASCCDHGLSVYKYINGKPIMIEESEVAQDPDDDTRYITTVKKRINGEMKLVKKTIDIDKRESNDVLR